MELVKESASSNKLRAAIEGSDEPLVGRGSAHIAEHDQRLYEKLDIEYNRMLTIAARPKPRPQALPPGKETHAMRNRKKQLAGIDKENQRMFHRLQNIWREPPAKFHAPSGKKSVNAGELTSVKPLAKRPDEWPAAPPSDFAFTKGLQQQKTRQKVEEERRIAKENEALREKILRPFSGRSGYAKAMGSQPLDTSQAWTGRLTHYEDRAGIIPRKRPATAGDPDAARALSEQLAGTSDAACAAMDDLMTRERTVLVKPHPTGVKVNQKGVPKTLGLACCRGCGNKSFFLGDGKPVFPCPKCSEVYYCSKACFEVDWVQHRMTCAGGGKVGQSWNPYGGQAEADFWVTNGAMAEARKLLKKKDQIWGPGNDTIAVRSIKKRYEQMRYNEQFRDMEMALVGQMQEMGMNGGPRACMHYPTTKLEPTGHSL